MAKIPKSVYFRYLLMNLPGLIGFVLVLIIVGRLVYLPAWIFWVLAACWLAKDVVLFPFVWRSYEPNDSVAGASLAGKRGVVKTRLDPSGYIEVRGELWRAEQTSKGPPIEVGRTVLIQRMEGLTLFVKEDDPDGKPAGKK
jgi:membrane protein implicated in regulation of membrane protease activity